MELPTSNHKYMPPAKRRPPVLRVPPFWDQS
jgi:hypothetical protein